MENRFPIIMEQEITRAEIIEALRFSYQRACELEKRDDPTFSRFPDMETILDWIDINGLPPKT